MWPVNWTPYIIKKGENWIWVVKLFTCITSLDAQICWQLGLLCLAVISDSLLWTTFSGLHLITLIAAATINIYPFVKIQCARRFLGSRRASTVFVSKGSLTPQAELLISLQHFSLIWININHLWRVLKWSRSYLGLLVFNKWKVHTCSSNIIT